MNPGAYTVKLRQKASRRWSTRRPGGGQSNHSRRFDPATRRANPDHYCDLGSPCDRYLGFDLGGTVSNASMLALPLNGRNFQRLIDLPPGSDYRGGSGHGNGDYTNGDAGKGTTSIGWKVSPQSPRPPAYRRPERRLPGRRFKLPGAHRCHPGIQYRAESQGGIWLEGGLGRVRWVKSGTNSPSRHGLRIWARCQRHGCGQLLQQRRLPPRPWSNLGPRRGAHYQGQALLICRLRGSARQAGGLRTTDTIPTSSQGSRGKSADAIEHGGRV